MTNARSQVRFYWFAGLLTLLGAVFVYAAISKADADQYPVLKMIVLLSGGLFVVTGIGTWKKAKWVRWPLLFSFLSLYGVLAAVSAATGRVSPIFVVVGLLVLPILGFQAWKRIRQEIYER